MHIINILALILIIVGIILFAIRNPIKNLMEGLDNKTREENQQKMLEDQYKYYSNRKLSRMVDQEQRITDSRIIKDTIKKNKMEISPGVDGVGKEKSEIQKNIEKCRQINEIGDCALLQGTQCGYCLSSNKILYGDANGPLEDTCEKGKWSPPGANAPENCTKMKERAICGNQKDCGDVGGNKSICAWCPVKGRGMVFKYNKEGGKTPKYAEDKCEWPYNNAVNPKWFGWEGNQSDTRTYKTISEPKEILDKPNESTGAFIDSHTDLKLGFRKYKEKGARYAKWDESKRLWNFHKAGNSDDDKNPKTKRVDEWNELKIQTGGQLGNQILEDGQGECDKDSDCAPGLKCGQRGSSKLDGVNNLEGRQINKDFCYDPNVKSMQGPLVPLESCKTFEANFPCMTPNLLTGPHTNACYQDLWKKSGCTGDVMQRATSSDVGRKTMENWNKSSFTVVLDNMKSFFNTSKSYDYDEANVANKMCYGKDIDPCESRFVDKNQKISRPRACIDKMYNEGGCTKKGKIHPDNLKDWKGYKGGGIPANWEENQNYGWSAYGYRGKIKEIKRNADKYKTLMGSGANKKALADYADKAIYYNELCYGETPNVPTIESGIKPCWKDFTALMIEAHPGVRLPDSETLIFNKKDLGIENSYMNDNNIFRRTLGKLNLLGQDWGSQKKVTKTMYEKEHFPYWKFYHKSRKIYQTKPKWVDFRDRVKKVASGAHVMSDKIQFQETHRMAILFKMHNIDTSKTSSQNIRIGSSHSNNKRVKLPKLNMQVGTKPQNGQDPNWRDRFKTTVNGRYVTVTRLDQNSGWGQNLYLKATTKTLAPFILTKDIWMRDDFPYNSFMKVLKNMEKNYL